MNTRCGRRVRAGSYGAVLTLAGALVSGLLASPATAAPARDAVVPAAAVAVHGGQSVGDSLFPTIGNTGYDVTHYGIALTYDASGTISASTTIEAQTTVGGGRTLASFSLDLEGLHVDRVVVNGAKATFSRHRTKLLVTPAAALRGRFVVTVGYHGRPVTHIDPDGAKDGWIPGNGGATTLSEPVGAQTWFPDNNTPRDKATYDVSVRAASSLAVAGNGVLRSRTSAGGQTTWHWRESRPMATYLAMVSIGKYKVTQTTLRLRSGRRIPVWNFVQPSLGSLAKQRVAVAPIVAFAEQQYGSYPFESVGIVVAELNVGYSLETQTRPVFDGVPGHGAMVHEFAHQWFGDSLTIRDWGDIWLNEGFATYAEDNWAAAHGGPSIWQAFHKVYDAKGASSSLWRPAPHRLKDPADLFGSPVYDRGALTLEALRHTIGAGAMTTLLHRWTGAHSQGVVSTAEFVALAQQVSGRRLGSFFHVWLDYAAKPKGY